MKSKKYVDLLQIFSTGTSIFLNTILIILIITKSPKHLGSYKYLMIYISIYELVYAILDVLLAPLIFSQGSIFLVIISTIDNRLTTNKQVLLYLNSIWCAFFGAFMGVFALQFIYRYYVISGSIKIKSFNDYRIVFWMSIPIITGVIWGILTQTLIVPTEQTDRAIENVLLIEFDTHIDDIIYVGPYLYQKQLDGSVKINKESMIAMIVMMSIILFSISFIIFSAIKCFLKLIIFVKVNRSLSRNYNSFQKQLFYALIVQTLIPLILMHFPALTLFICTMLDINLGHISVVVTITVAIFPALDPLPVMLIIKDYRCALSSSAAWTTSPQGSAAWTTSPQGLAAWTTSPQGLAAWTTSPQGLAAWTTSPQGLAAWTTSPQGSAAWTTSPQGLAP
ncbi:unnamed protein product [Caenorhabditis angaria]|uniref:Serpentine receptor class r-10 n=1 Tax=Caenorhabditis angaria TaxID=860376 RepID=A0A9P1IWN9_9PELO|nr:unnamed protein product [Caenorhabditis angaria]